jgi:integrase
MRTTVWSEKSRLTGTYSVRYYDPDTGAKKRVLCPTYTAMQEKRDEIKNLLRSRRMGGNTAHPLALFDRYLEANRLEMRRSTLIRKNVVRTFLADYTAMDQLTPEVIDRWKNTLSASGKKISTVAYMLSALRAFINWCRKARLSTINPFEQVKVPRMEETGRRLTDEEVQRIFKVMEGPLKPLIITFLETGCRRQELIGMKPAEIDFTLGAWTIPAERSKTKRSRMIPLTPNVLQALKTNDLGGERIWAGWSEMRLYKAWVRTLRRAGIMDRVRLHDLRHTFASNWKGRAETLMAVCGWSTMTMMNRYKHVWFKEIQADMNPGVPAFGGNLGEVGVLEENKA